MRKNKILTAAIASVVSLSGGITLFSGTEAFAALVSHGGTAPSFATQLFPGNTNIATNIGIGDGIKDENGVAGSGISNTDCLDLHALKIEYKIPLPQALTAGDALRVTANLSGSAGWATRVDPATQVRFCSSGAGATTGKALVASVAFVPLPGPEQPVGGTCTDATNTVISKVSPVDDIGQSSVQFLIQALAGVNAQVGSSYFYFCPDIDADFLQDAGSLSLTLSSEWVPSFGTATALGTPQTDNIANSVPGLRPTIDDGRSDPQLNKPLPSEAAISFNADSLKFATGATKTSMADTPKVSLGRILLFPEPGSVDRDGLNDYFPNLNDWVGTLTIVNGPFSASTAPNSVFLDNDGDCVFDEKTIPPSRPATKVTGTVAEWTDLSIEVNNSSTLLDLMTNVNEPGMHVCVIADGVTPIEEQTQAPVATLKMGASAQSIKSYSGRLRHLKENGTRCSLFNVPDGTESLGGLISTDVVSVRITNNGPAEGTLYATLYDQNGKPIYSPKRQQIGAIKGFETLRYYTGQETSVSGYDPVFDLTTYGSAQHWVGQRATLVVATELPNISVFGLVRNRNSGPNMNMSTGATGSGCD